MLIAEERIAADPGEFVRAAVETDSSGSAESGRALGPESYFFYQLGTPLCRFRSSR